MTEDCKLEWDLSYKRKENYLFYPDEEVIKFFARYVVKKTGLSTSIKHVEKPKMLDLGCGIGRHVLFGLENNVDSYGVDLSEEAIGFAKSIASEKGIDKLQERFIVSDIRNLPYENNEFNLVVSHGVLDSMPFEIACNGIKEIWRVAAEDCLFYCDLISSQALVRNDEERVESIHEQGTIQSYFDKAKINTLFDGYFDLISHCIIENNNLTTGSASARHHLVLKKNSSLYLNQI